MQDYEYLISKEVHKKLKSKVKGKVWVKVYNDELHIKITNIDNLKFETTLDDLADKILHGLSAELIAHLALKEYKEGVIKRYFK